VKVVDDMRKSSPERMCNLSASPGVYFIAVTHGERDEPRGSAESSYRLMVSGRSALVEEREPNDGPAAANPLEPGKETEGYFSPAYNRMNEENGNTMTEEDWFSVSLGTETKYPAVLDLEITGVPGINSALGFFTDSRAMLASADVNPAGGGEIIRDIGITAPGTYYIRVASKNFEANHDVPYRLSATLKEFDSTAEMEPNNDTGTANPLSGTELKGRVYPGGDRDFFVHRNAPKQFYRVEVHPPEHLDVTLAILGNDGTRLFECDNGGPGGREVVPNLHAEMEFYPVVTAKRGMFDRENTYRLLVSALTPESDMEFEPNDRRETATRVKGKAIMGYVSRKKDVDYFLFEYGRREKRSFQLNGIKGARLRVSVTDPFGYALKSEEVEGGRKAAISEMIDQKGYVIIESLQDNYDAPYTLHAREER
jgi:hypothetical protein